MPLKEYFDNPGEIAGIPGSAHCTSIFKTEREQFGVVVPFILAGLNRGDKCVYIVDDTPEDDIIEAIMSVKDVQTHLERGDIAFLNKDEAYLKDGFFDADRMLRFVRDAEERACADGYAGLTATGEMSWQRTDAPGTDMMMSYEARLNNLCGESGPTLLCQYEEPLFDHATLIDVIRTHPRVVLDGEWCVNPHYMPPDEFLTTREGVIPRETYDRTCLDILRRNRFSMIHRMEMRDFRKLRKRLSALENVGLSDLCSFVEVVDFYTDLARESCGDAATLSHLEAIARRCNEAQKRLRFLRSYQSIGESVPTWHELDGILDMVCAEVDNRAISKESFGGNVEIMADVLFGDAILALVENMPSLRNSSDEVRIGSCHEGGDLVIYLENDDDGVPNTVKDAIFRLDCRYGQSDGFGLFLAAKILSSLGMTICENGAPGESTRFEIRIPAGRHRATTA
ncbi:MAG: MEDS domain-containing protein [Methanobacteriota archaeon]|nr:MAG: MEDS domain-containing protein [Euryarchaeota archaeon]